MLGAPLERGYDSHVFIVVNDGQEIIIYDAAQILPCYIVSWNWGELNQIGMLDGNETTVVNRMDSIL